MYVRGDCNLVNSIFDAVNMNGMHLWRAREGNSYLAHFYYSANGRIFASVAVNRCGHRPIRAKKKRQKQFASIYSQFVYISIHAEVGGREVASSIITSGVYLQRGGTSNHRYYYRFPRFRASVARAYTRTHTYIHAYTKTTHPHTRYARRDTHRGDRRASTARARSKFDSHSPNASKVDESSAGADGRGRKGGLVEVHNAPRGDDAAPDKSSVGGGHRGIRAPAVAARQRTLDNGPRT